MNDLVLQIDKEAIKRAYEHHSSNRVGLGESAGILPDLDTISCLAIDEEIKNAEKFSQQIKLTGELADRFNEWMKRAKEKQIECKKTINPIPKNKISKNLTPIVIITGAIVAGIIASKIFQNEK